MTTDELKHAIADYCAGRLEIIACYLFGSRARGLDRPGSDVDLAFLLYHHVPGSEYFNLKMEYMNGLGYLTRLDIHPLIMNDAGEVVLGQIFRKGVSLFERDIKLSHDFRRRKLPMIAEFSYYLDLRARSLRTKYGGSTHG